MRSRNRNVFFLSIVILVMLAAVVPYSSRKPDAVQHVIGLPGGVDRFPRALLGMAVAFMAVWVVLKIVKKRK